MKLISIACTFATAGSLVAASPSHRHHHSHVEKRQPNKVEVITINEYVVNGNRLSLDEVCAGIQSGTLRPSDGSTNLTECQRNNGPPQEEINVEDPAPVIVLQSASTEASIAPASSVPAQSTPTPEIVKPSDIPGKKPSKAKAFGKGETSVPAPASSTPTPASYAPTGKGIDREFPTNAIDCSTFPSEYGPIPIDWMELGGWSGIQYVTETNGVITEVVTAIKGDRCKSGGMCSYACPPGWQKTQWPTVPPAQGRSVGGLFCNDQNKLELTNPTLSKSLCMKGTGATRVENKLSLDAMICRTDYPGEWTLPNCASFG
jgi:SUN family beta-glucosidase